MPERKSEMIIDIDDLRKIFLTRCIQRKPSDEHCLQKKKTTKFRFYKGKCFVVVVVVVL